MPVLLQIDSTSGVGSTGRISETIARLAMEEGWTCHIAHSCRYAGKTIQNNIRIGSKFEEYVHFAKSFLFDKHGLGSASATRNLIGKIEEIKPDVIQLHCIHGYYLNYRILFEYLAKHDIPVVWTQHDCWAVTGHCAHFEKCGCKKWMTQCGNCPQIHTYPVSITDRSEKNHLLKKETFSSCGNMNIVYVSRWLESVLKNSFLGQFPSFVFPNGVDTSSFKPQIENTYSIKSKYGIPDKFIVLGVSSQWTEQKGLPLFISLREKLDERFVIVLVGLAKSQLSKLPDGIVGIQRTESKQELAALYSAAGIFANMSLEETFGLVTAEAISCGTPAIVFNSTACPEVVGEGTGYIIRPNDIDAVAETVISEFKKTAEQNAETRKKCREFAERKLDENVRFRNYVNLYNQLIRR